MAQYDALVVGAGLYGSVWSHEAKKLGLRVLVIDSRDHIAGNCYTQEVDSIQKHVYGCHIFHVNDKKIWDYVNQFAEFLHYKYSPKIIGADGNMYSFPLNLFTMYQVFGTKTPDEARLAVQADIDRSGKQDTSNLEGWAISQIGRTLYELFIKNYTERHWARPASELPSSIIKRLPIRFSHEDSYFLDKYSGIPQGGYTQIFEKMLDGIEVRLNTPYEHSMYSLADRIIFTGGADDYYAMKFGPLEYRSLRFVTRRTLSDFQGTSVINYANDAPYNRIVEHAWFEGGPKGPSIITQEYPQAWEPGRERYYPVNTQENQDRYSLYMKHHRESGSKVRFRGRIGGFVYRDMAPTIAAALHDVQKELGNAPTQQERRYDTGRSAS